MEVRVEDCGTRRRILYDFRANCLVAVPVCGVNPETVKLW